MSEAVTYKRHPTHTSWFFGDNGTAFQTHWGRTKILKPNPNNRGYVKIRMNIKGKFKAVSLHRLVVGAFLKESPQEVNHKDSNKSNNRLDNLEYCSRGENVRHCNMGRKRFVYPETGKENSYWVRIAKDKKYYYSGSMYPNKEEAYKEAHKLFTTLFGFEPWRQK